MKKLLSVNFMAWRQQQSVMGLKRPAMLFIAILLLAGCQADTDDKANAQQASQAEPPLICESLEDCQYRKQRLQAIVAAKQQQHQQYIQTLEKKIAENVQRLTDAQDLQLSIKAEMVAKEIAELKSEYENEQRNFLLRLEKLQRPLPEIEAAIEKWQQS